MIILGVLDRVGFVYLFYRGRGRSMECNEEKHGTGPGGLRVFRI
jgi:hypothetical protein